ncbi:hypothetical protein NB706_002551 [Xanthomonas sacchari]|nr:hypothetical protein [Xanthomonas sacchari]
MVFWVPGCTSWVVASCGAASASALSVSVGVASPCGACEGGWVAAVGAVAVTAKALEGRLSASSNAAVNRPSEACGRMDEDDDSGRMAARRALGRRGMVDSGLGPGASSRQRVRPD